MDCYGKQHTIEKMREDKAEMFKKLKNKRNSKDYEWWFLRYRPGDSGAEKKKKRKRKTKKNKKKRRRRRRRTRKKGLLNRLFS